MCEIKANLDFGSSLDKTLWDEVQKLERVVGKKSCIQSAQDYLPFGKLNMSQIVFITLFQIYLATLFFVMLYIWSSIMADISSRHILTQTQQLKHQNNV